MIPVLDRMSRCQAVRLWLRGHWATPDSIPAGAWVMHLPDGHELTLAAPVWRCVLTEITDTNRGRVLTNSRRRLRVVPYDAWTAGRI